jgi:hypothetical protein
MWIIFAILISVTELNVGYGIIDLGIKVKDVKEIYIDHEELIWYSRAIILIEGRHWIRVKFWYGRDTSFVIDVISSGEFRREYW